MSVRARKESYSYLRCEYCGEKCGMILADNDFISDFVCMDCSALKLGLDID